MSVEKCGEFFVGYAASVPVFHSYDAKNTLAKCIKRKGTLAAYPAKDGQAGSCLCLSSLEDTARLAVVNMLSAVRRGEERRKCASGSTPGREWVLGGCFEKF